MTALFAFAAAVQVDDPDPIRWASIYAAAAAVSLQMALRRQAWPFAAPALAAVAALWAAWIAAAGPALEVYGRMFDAWEMASEAVEEAREASGLLIVAAWMTVLHVRWRKRARKPGDRT